MQSGLLCFDKPALLEKRVQLLIAIKNSGSITTAAKQVGISYKTAWETLDAMNNLSKKPLVLRVVGGSGGGGTTLTEYGEDVILHYEILRKEYERFVKTLSSMAEFNVEHIANMQRIAMQISARNQLMGKVAFFRHTNVSAEVGIVLKSGVNLVSSITNSALEELCIEVGDEVVAIFKASSVLIAKAEAMATSARNRLDGKIVDIKEGEVNSQVVIDIGGGDVVVSTITTDSVKNLGLQIGLCVSGLIKASSILVGK